MVYNLKMLSKRYVAFTRVVKESLDAIPLELAKDHPLQLEYILLKTKYLGFIRQWDEWLVVDQDHSQKTKILLEILSDLKNHISRFLKALNQISDDYRKEILDINLKKFIEVEERILDVIKQFNSNDLNQILQQYHEILEWTFKEYLNLIIGGILYDPMGKNFTLRNYVESVFEKAGVYLPREISNQLVQEKLFRVCKMAFFEIAENQLKPKFFVSREQKLSESDMVSIKNSIQLAVNEEMKKSCEDLPSFKSVLNAS